VPSVSRRPFVGSGGRYSPGPASTPPLLAMSSPLNDALASPWVLRRTSPVLGGEADSRHSLRSTCLPTVSSADFHSELGPRSLDPDRSFWSAFAELIRGQSSPAELLQLKHDVRAMEPVLLILAGTEASTSFLF
jgi:hypothetical protein